jgi:hypothetical protein
MSPAARERAYRRHLRAEMERVSQIAKQRLREAIAEGLIEGRIEGGEIIVEVTDPPAANSKQETP